MITAARTAFFAFVARLQQYNQRAPVENVKAETELGYGEPEVVETEEGAEIRVYAFIDSHGILEMWGIPGTVAVSDTGFARALAKAKATGKPVSVRLNSPGGDVFAGVAIASMVRENSLPVRVDGVAASIASIIMAASPKVTMAPGATVMVHKPWSCACGNATAFRAEASVLDKLEANMVDIYVLKTREKYDRASWLAALTGPEGSDGTWWSGADALSAGLADEYEAEELPEPKRAALLQQRRMAAAVHGVALPKNLEEPDGSLVPPMQPAPKGGLVGPSVRVSHRKGAFYPPNVK